MCLRECLCSWLCTGYKHCMFSLEGGTRSVPTFHIFNPNSLVPCCFPSSSRSCSNCITNTVSDSQYTYVYSETGTHAHCLVQHLKKIETIVQQALVRMWVTDRVNAFNEQQQWRNRDYMTCQLLLSITTQTPCLPLCSHRLGGLRDWLAVIHPQVECSLIPMHIACRHTVHRGSWTIVPSQWQVTEKS